MRPRGAVGSDAHAVGGDFAGKRFGIGERARARTGKANVNGIDAERLHKMQDFDFVFDAGVGNRRILKAVAKRFVIEHDARARRNLRRRRGVPIVDPIEFLHEAARTLLEMRN